MSDSLSKRWLAAISLLACMGLEMVALWWRPTPLVHQAVLILGAAGAGLTLNRIHLLEQQKCVRERTAVFQDVLERLADCTLVLNAEGRIDNVSPGAKRFGMEPASMLGQPWREVFPPANHPLFAGLLESVGMGQPGAAGPCVYELHLTRGDRRFIEVTVFQFRTGTGAQNVILLRDVTERQVVREGMAHMDRMSAVAHLSAGIAHNFNNILAGIMLNAGLLADAEGAERLLLSERVIASAERGAALCRNLVTFARGQAPALGAVPVRPLMSDLILLFETEANRYSVTLTWDADPSLTVWGDRTQIQQILLNLLFNAREAVGTNGSVRISAADVEGNVHITVSNGGPSIPPEHLPLIFLPFFSTKGEHPHGYGMGLAVCLSLARGMGGTIAVTSPLGGETAFSLVLPGIHAA